MSEPGDSPHCLNCGASLSGQYCGQCGQRATARFISLFELIRDAFGDLFELDSRLWRTLIPLLRKPGLLTKDYLEGKRARYMPPFRMYLVLSLVFFAVAFFDPQDELAIFYEEPPAVTSELTEAPGKSQEDIDVQIEEARNAGRVAIEQLIADGIIQPEDIPEEYRNVPDEPDEADEADLEADAEQDEDDNVGLTINFDESDDTLDACTLDEADLSDFPVWLQKRLTKERLERTCERVKEAGAKGFMDAIVGKIPAGLIILLPFMAFVLKTLYPLSRRYYVEHLLFFVHFHAFFFLMLSLQILLSRLGSWIGFMQWLFTLVIVAASFYIPIYLFISMRRVYGQGRVITFLKYIWLVSWYVIGFTSVMLGAAIIAVFSI